MALIAVVDYFAGQETPAHCSVIIFSILNYKIILPAQTQKTLIYEFKFQILELNTEILFTFWLDLLTKDENKVSLPRGMHVFKKHVAKIVIFTSYLAMF